MALLSGTGAVFVTAIHFDPAAVEPPADIIGPYEVRIVGWLAFLWLVVVSLRCQWTTTRFAATKI